jgi:hypothetical protein
MHRSRHINTYSLGILIVILLCRNSTSTLLRHGYNHGTSTKQLTQNTNRHAKHGNNLLTQRRNIKQKKPKGSKYYHLDDDDDNDVIDVNTDQHNATEEMRNDPTSLPNTTITTSTSKTISDVTPASSPTITVPISSVNASTRKSAGSYAPVIKQTMKKSMDASTKDKLSKKQTMTTSKKNHPKTSKFTTTRKTLAVKREI